MTQTSHPKNIILHWYNLISGVIHIDDSAYLLALYENAPDALAHFISLFFHIAFGNTAKIPPLRSEWLYCYGIVF